MVSEGKLLSYDANSSDSSANLLQVASLLSYLCRFVFLTDPLHSFIHIFSQKHTDIVCVPFFFLQLKCGNCGEVSDKWQYVTLVVRAQN